MIYKLETYDKKTFELSEKQYQIICRQIDTAKFLNINGVVVATGSVKELYPDYEAANDVKQQKKDAEMLQLTESAFENIAGFLATGNVKTENKELREKLKNIWIEHIKRRPMIDKMKEKERMKRWEEWKARAQLPLGDRRNSPPPFLLKPHYTQEELRIINS